MKIVLKWGALSLLCTIILCSSNVAWCDDESSDLKIKFDFPEAFVDGKTQPTVTLFKTAANAPFFVALENISSKPLVLAKGNGLLLTLHFEVTDENGKVTKVYQALPVWSAYVVRGSQLNPGQTTRVKISHVWASADTPWGVPGGNMPSDFEDCVWPFPFRDREQEKVTLRAVLDSESSKSGEAAQYWKGDVTSEPYEVILKE